MQAQDNSLTASQLQPEVHQFNIVAHNNPIVLEKMLQVVRYRGFAVNELEVKPQVCAKTNMNELLINLSVQSTNTVDLLTRQLEKVFDIVRVQQICSLKPIQQACN